MTTVYFIRHAQSQHWKDDRTRPLTDEGKADAKIVLDFLKDKSIDMFYCSPYKRSMDTIQEAADYFHKTIITDERLRERESGAVEDYYGMIEKRWQDHGFHEEGGESIRMVQERNVAALTEILTANRDKTLVIGTHGTALAAMINHYRPDFGYKSVRLGYLYPPDWLGSVVSGQEGYFRQFGICKYLRYAAFCTISTKSRIIHHGSLIPANF